jgi:hypothetical protein
MSGAGQGAKASTDMGSYCTERERGEREGREGGEREGKEKGEREEREERRERGGEGAIMR